MPYTTINGDNAKHEFPEGSFVSNTDPNALATGANNSLDSAAVALAVGDTVKVTGTIVAIDPRATHFDGVTVRLTNPDNTVKGPLYQALYKFHPNQLTKV